MIYIELCKKDESGVICELIARRRTVRENERRSSDHSSSAIRIRVFQARRRGRRRTRRKSLCAGRENVVGRKTREDESDETKP